MEQAFLYWVSEREKIRKKKEAGEPWPWTEDPIFQTYKFCNVRRKDDKVSRWLRTNLYESPLFGLWEDLPNFLCFAALCRHLNWPPAILEVVGLGGWGPAGYDGWRVGQILLNRQGQGLKVFSNAYLVRGSMQKGVSKIPFICEIVCGQRVKRRLPLLEKALSTRSKEAVANTFQSVEGIGSFMAGQITDDLTWCSVLQNPIDQYTWAPMGPGSRRGFNRMLSRPLHSPITKEEWKTNLINWRLRIRFELGSEFTGLSLHDVQNCLCEFDKYLRVKEGGRMKNKYQPKTEGQW